MATKKEKKEIVAVKFVKSHTPYVVGDIAGFNAKTAEKLVKMEVAKKVTK